jgi:hypothetical protein
MLDVTTEHEHTYAGCCCTLPAYHNETKHKAAEGEGDAHEDHQQEGGLVVQSRDGSTGRLESRELWSDDLTRLGSLYITDQLPL